MVTIMQLDWHGVVGHPESNIMKASSIVGSYRVRRKDGCGFEIILFNSDSFPFYETMDEAKAAAQIDFECKVRSAIIDG